MTVADPTPPATPGSPRRESGLGLAIVLGLMLLSVVLVAVACWWLLATRASTVATKATSTAISTATSTATSTAISKGAADSPAISTASATRLSLATDPQHAPLQVVRISPPGTRPQELQWDVTLIHVPTGKSLDLRGEWLDASGRVVHRNSYRTKTVTHDPWTTHIRYQLPGDAMVGAWRVRLLTGKRTIAEQMFQVERP